MFKFIKFKQFKNLAVIKSFIVTGTKELNVDKVWVGFAQKTNGTLLSDVYVWLVTGRS